MSHLKLVVSNDIVKPSNKRAILTLIPGGLYDEEETLQTSNPNQSKKVRTKPSGSNYDKLQRMKASLSSKGFDFLR